jgi:hypothetical protein
VCVCVGVCGYAPVIEAMGEQLGRAMHAEARARSKNSGIWRVVVLNAELHN